jgi:eukaryotic-like serine/threonine-protein kinase
LTWLAVQMTQHYQTVFHLERMQPTWLPYRSQLQLRRKNFRKRTALRTCLLIGTLAIPAAAPLVGLFAAPLIGLFAALAAGAGVYIGTIRSFAEANEELRRRAAAAGVFTGSSRSLKEIAAELQQRAASGGPDPGLVLWEVIQWGFTSEEIISVETLRWSWSAFEPWQWRNMFIFILISGLGIGLAAWLFAGAAVGLFAGAAETLFWGLVCIPGAALASSEIETKNDPQGGIRRSARNARFMGLMGGVVGGIAGGLLAVLAYGLGFQPIYGVLSVLGFMLCFGLAAAMRYGGYTCLQHRRLRRLLVRRGLIPRHYVKFLDYAVQRIFLHKVGGGYIFIHPLLQNYFAAHYRE